MLFENNNYGFSARAMMAVGCEPWFVAKDVAEISGYSETAMMTRRLDDDEIRKIAPADLAGTNSSMAREFTIINESGLYNAIIGSGFLLRAKS